MADVKALPKKMSTSLWSTYKIDMNSRSLRCTAAVVLISVGIPLMTIPWIVILSNPEMKWGWTAAQLGMISSHKGSVNEQVTNGALSTRSDRSFEAFLYQRLFTERKTGHSIDDHFIVPAYSPHSTVRNTAPGKNVHS
jgi:hypothetical protein